MHIALKTPCKMTSSELDQASRDHLLTSAQLIEAVRAERVAKREEPLLPENKCYQVSPPES